MILRIELTLAIKLGLQMYTLLQIIVAQYKKYTCNTTVPQYNDCAASNRGIIDM